MASSTTQPRVLMTSQLVSTTSTASGTLLTPKGSMVSGIRPISISIERNSHGAIDTATIVLPVKSLDPSQSPIDWGNYITPGLQAQVKLYAGFPTNPAPGAFSANQLTKKFNGYVNSIEVNGEGTTATWTLSCRSLGSVLVDTKMTTQFLVGNTTTQFLQKWCADAHNLKLVTQLPPGSTPALMSSVFKQHQVVGVKNLKQWDLAVMCAQTDGCNVWVDDDTIYYVYPQATPNNNPYPVNCATDLITFKGSHSPYFNKNIAVRVHNWSPKIRTTHTVRMITANDGTPTTSSKIVVSTEGFGVPTSSSTTLNADGNTSSTNSSTSGGAQNTSSSFSNELSGKEVYDFWFHGKTLDELNTILAAKWAELSQFEYSIDISLPMTPLLLNNLSLSTLLKLSNSVSSNWNSSVKTTWNSATQGFKVTNTTYRIRRITERIDNSGWIVQITGVNHELPSNEGA